MTVGELARAMLAHGSVAAGAAAHLARGEASVGAEPTDDGREGAEVLAEVGAEPDGIDDEIPF
jgi:hypothetical protein